MHTLVTDNLTKPDYPASRRTDLHNSSYHAWFGVPDPIRCWLLGHKPEYLTTPVPRIRCARCYAAPALRQYAIEFLASGREPSPEWIADTVESRSGWTSQRQGKASAQVVIPTKPRIKVDLHLHIGGVGSETPWDGAINLAGAALYWSLGINGRLAQKLHPRSKGARDLRIAVDREESRYGRWIFRWSLWTDDWGRDTGLEEKAPAKWRRGYKTLSVADKLWGKVDVNRDVRDEKLVVVDLGDELTHLIRFELEWVVVGRPRQRAHTKERYWDVKWTAESGPNLHGIGMRTEAGPGGVRTWTRGRVFGSSLRLSHAEATSEAWEDHAVSALRRWVDQQRAKEDHPHAVHGG